MGIKRSADATERSFMSLSQKSGSNFQGNFVDYGRRAGRLPSVPSIPSEDQSKSLEIDQQVFAETSSALRRKSHHNSSQHNQESAINRREQEMSGFSEQARATMFFAEEHKRAMRFENGGTARNLETVVEEKPSMNDPRSATNTLMSQQFLS